MLDVLTAAVGTGSAFDALARGAPPLHLNLTMAAVASPAFARLAAACSTFGSRAIGVELSLMEVLADPALFAQARVAVAAAGCALVLDDVSHHAISLTRLAPLRPDLVKLAWSPRMASLAPEPADRLDAALAGLPAARLLLARAHSEAALRWGLARGIRRFQGSHVDAMLAASRLSSCAAADACTLRQCAERAAAAGSLSRRFCRNLGLLDAAAPAAAAGVTRRVLEAA